jgi:hypothetical protein
LPATADGERQLIVRHDDLDAALVLVDHYFGDFRWRQGVDHESRGIRRPGNDVDLLALQFADHRLNAAATHADAGADGIDRGIVGNHRDFGAAARIAGDRLDLDDAVVDLGHLLGEQHGHELWVGARQKDLRPAQLLAHIEDIGTHPVAGPERLARQAFVPAHQALGPAEVDRDVAELVALDDAVDDFAGAVLELLVLALTLGFADLLDDHLLGGLGGDAPEVDGREVLDQEFAHAEAGLARRGLLRGHLGELVLDLLDHLAEPAQVNFAGAPVDFRPDIVLVAVLGAASLADRLLHGLENLFALDAFLPRHGIRDLKKLRSRKRLFRFQTDPVLFHAHEAAAKAPPALHRDAQLNSRLEAGEALEILKSGQRPVDARRADFQHIGTRDRILNVQNGAHEAAGQRAIVHADGAAVLALDHDLELGAAVAGKEYAHDVETFGLQGRRHQTLDRFGPAFAGQSWHPHLPVGSLALKASSVLPDGTKKVGRWPTLRGA